jgi:two-component system CheB/CheR fusion protein
MTESATHRPFSVLVVEDEPDLVFFLARAFESIRGRVTTAVDGVDALQKVESSAPFDLVLLDLGLPQMDGREFLARLHRISPETSVIISTGYTPSFTEDEAKRFVAILSKPYGMDELISVTKQVLRQFDPAPKTNL